MPETSSSNSGSRQPADPFMAFRFQVFLRGRSVLGGFSDVTGLGVDTEVETFRAGGENGAEIMLAGPAKFASRLSLKRGLGHTASLWRWYQAVMQGTMARQDVTIEMSSAAGDEPLRWTFREALPVRWTGPELHAAASAVAFESVDLVHKGVLLPSQ